MLYSTKRKLHNLLNGPPAPTSPSTPARSSTDSVTSPSTAAAADSAKKRKMAERPLSSRPSIRAVSPTGSVCSAVSTTFSAQSPIDGDEKLAYTPWDRAAFLERLASYRYVDKWSAKPSAVNEVAWSKRGWVCVEKNRVQCNLCAEEVSVQVAVDDDEETVKKFEAMILKGHDELCLWKKKGCDETIYRLPIAASNAVSRAKFTTRYLSLLKVSSEIPSNLSHPPIVQSSIFYPPEATADEPILESAAIMALFGWQNEEPSIPSLVTCSACFRRLGLWLFQKKASVGEEASVCRLDVVEEHREYCPWINAESQGKEPAWESLLRILQYQPKGISRPATAHGGSPVGERSLTEAEKDSEVDAKVGKLRRLKSLYFGKKKKDAKGKGKENETEKEKGVETGGAVEQSETRDGNNV